uniref:Uncharacterized protein n=1 Tax=Panagrellus redivivus TaxID=6233 RepID=A0A7E4ZXV5_PANRE
MDNSNDRHNPHMCHSQGFVNYIGSFVENNHLVYFAHDAVHYTGVQINGCAGIDACFGRVTFVTHDFCLPNKDAYNEAFERARRKRVVENQQILERVALWRCLSTRTTVELY